LSDYGLAIWQVLFVLVRIDWGEGIGQVEASVGGDGEVGARGTVVSEGRGGDDTWRTPEK